DDFVNSEAVTFRNHLAFDGIPLRADPAEQRVDWHAAVFVLCNSPLDFAALECLWQRSNSWNDVSDQTRQLARIELAIIQDPARFVVREWRALEDPPAHVMLVCGVNPVLKEIAQHSIE